VVAQLLCPGVEDCEHTVTIASLTPHTSPALAAAVGESATRAFAHAGHSNDADCLLDPQLIRIGRAIGKATSNGSAGVERALCAPAGLGYRQVGHRFWPA
jgi:hypothetical protein